MNMKLIGLTAAFALLASTTVYAQQQPFGRDSVYTPPDGASTPAQVGTSTGAARARTAPGNGRGSVYARNLPAPTPRDQVTVRGPLKPGRA